MQVDAEGSGCEVGDDGLEESNLPVGLFVTSHCRS